MKRTIGQHVDEVVKFLAWSITVVSEYKIEKLLEYNGLATIKSRKEIMQSKEWALKIIKVRAISFHVGYYALQPKLQWEVLWEIKDENLLFPLYKKISKSGDNSFYYERSAVIEEDQCNAIRNEIFLWAKNKPLGGALKDVDFENPLTLTFFATSIFSHEWDGILDSVPTDAKAKMIKTVATITENSFDNRMIDNFIATYFNGNVGRVKVLSNIPILPEVLMMSHILPGKLHHTEFTPEYANSIFARYLAALQLQYAGEYKSALDLYKKTLKIDKFTLLPSHPFFAMTYILALKEVKLESSINALRTIEKKVFDYSDLLHVKLLLHHFLEKETESVVEMFKKKPGSPLSHLLFILVAKHFNLFAEVKTTELFSAKIDFDNFKLLQLEASTAFPQFQARQQKLIDELNLKPLLKKQVVLSKWEKAIEEIEMVINSLPTKSTKGTKSETAGSRIYYLLEDGVHFIPRLQTSTNGVTWTKGRNIALKTFKEGKVNGMSEVDHKVATHVTFEREEGWYGKINAYLYGGKVFAELINHPHVFQAENPDLNIQILKGEPHIEVIKENNGYTVVSNIKREFRDKVVVVPENDVLYRVFTLSNIQYKMLQALSPKMSFPADAKNELTELLTKMAAHITVHSDLVAQSSTIKKTKGDARITVQLLPIADGVKAELFVKPMVDSAPYCKAGIGNASCMGVSNGVPVLAERNLKVEKENYKTINALFQTITHDNSVEDIVYFDNYYGCLELVEKMQELDKVARLEWPQGAKLTVKKMESFQQMKVNVRSVGSWFEVDGEVKVDKKLQISLAQLLEKSRESNGRFVEIAPNEYLALTNELRAKLNELDARLIYDRKKMQLSPFSTSIINDLDFEGMEVKVDDAFLKLQKQIEEAEYQQAEVPAALKAELRDYQLDGYQWLSRLATWGAGACLADDMGLGKTVQSIALMLSRANNGPILIVAPASVVPNWRNELNRFAPTLNCKVLHENISLRKDMVESAEAFDVVVSTYGLLNTENEILTAKKWEVIVLDEAHNIKNRETKMSKASMNLQGNFRLILTGTPIQNHLGEIWNLFRFTNPGLLGSFEYFSKKFIFPIEKENDKLIQKQLKKILQPFMLRRTKSEVLDELPSKTEITYEVELSKEERAHYENIRALAVANLEEGSLNPIQTLAEITKLRQAACHPALVNDELNLSSSKVAAFTEIVDNLLVNKHKALVFSQFTSFLKLIRQELDKRGTPYLYLDGATPIKEREKLVNSFQRGNTPLFLISLKAGGTGLNLTAADYVIHLDPWWNPAIEDQATDRSHRIGQTHPVTIYKLIAKQTIEEKILALHKSKKSLADSLLEGSNMSHKLSRNEMLELLKGGGA